MGVEATVVEILKEPGGVYRQGDLVVLPQPPQKVLVSAYLRFEEEDLLRYIFYQGAWTLPLFLQNFSQHGTLACYVGESLAGLGWTNSVERVANRLNRAEISEGFFKGTPIDTTLALGKLMLEWAFDTYKLDVAYGTTPVPNRAARIFAKRIGFEECGVLPSFAVWEGEPCDVSLTAMTRQRWEALKDGRIQTG